MATDLIPRLLTAIREAAGPGPVGLHVPEFGGNESRYLQECIDSTFVSSVGPFVDRFERELAAFTGARHAVAVVNGTAALHIALRLAGVKPGDEVLIPALTFVATANAVMYCGASPHFVDSEPVTLGVDPRALREHLLREADLVAGECVNRRTRRPIRALVPMHTFGHPSDMDGLRAVAKDFHLALVEDAAESLGSYHRGAHTGTLGLLGTLSFNGNKVITTGGGGAILTNDPELARRAKHLTTTAKVPHRWEYVHDEVGYNYRMPNLNAALGCAQLERLPAMLEAKRRLFSSYETALREVPEVSLVREPEGCRSNYWLQAILLQPGHENARDGVLAATNDAGLMTRPVWRLLHRLAPFASCPRMSLAKAEAIEAALINLPSSANLPGGLPQ